MDEPEDILEEDIDEIIELAETDPANGVHLDSDDENEEDGMVCDEQFSHATTSEDVEVNDDALITFRKHAGEVFSVDIGPENSVCTGGEDDKALVWNRDSGEILYECSGHKDSVVCVKFNAKKTLLATADLSGLIMVRSTTDYTVTQTFDTGCDLEWILWHHTADILFSGGADSSVWMWLVPSNNCKIYAGHGPTCTAACLLPDGKRLCAGYADGTVKVWDLKENSALTVNGATCHTDSVTCIDCNCDNNIAASGSLDGTVNLFHCSNGKLIDTIVCAKSNDTEKENGSDQSDATISVETVSFSAVSHLLAAGTVTGELVLWDTGARQVRQSLKHPDGLVKALWMDAFLFTSCLDGIVRAWDCNSGALVEQWTGHTKEILDFVLDRERKQIITTSADQSSRVFALNKSTCEM